MRETPPFVSVVCPIYNSEKYVRTIVPSLLSQTYGAENYEVVFVDNGSSDRTVERLREYPVRVLERPDVRSSYAARNLGIDGSRGEILAFIDADCRADRHWIERGVASIVAGTASLTAGQVDFDFRSTWSAAEWLDSISHMNNEEAVKKHRCAMTANVFLSRDVIRKIGKFDETFKSGGDVEFTRRATNSGLVLDFCPEAKVFHPTRGFLESIVKQFRVGTGIPRVILRSKKSSLGMLLAVLKACFVPQSPIKINRKVSRKKTRLLLSFRVIAMNLLLKIVQLMAVSIAVLRIAIGK